MQERLGCGLGEKRKRLRQHEREGGREERIEHSDRGGCGVFLNPEHRAHARKLAEESMVLAWINHIDLWIASANKQVADDEAAEEKRRAETQARGQRDRPGLPVDEETQEAEDAGAFAPSIRVDTQNFGLIPRQ